MKAKDRAWRRWLADWRAGIAKAALSPKRHAHAQAYAGAQFQRQKPTRSDA